MRVWCAQHTTGWCATMSGLPHKDGQANVRTACNQFIIPPIGIEHREPDCPECQEKIAARIDWDGVYSILVEHAGAPEYERMYFIAGVAETGFSEWCFNGWFGSGSKFRYEGDRRGYVSCYPEDRTPERIAVIADVNKRLKEFFK